MTKSEYLDTIYAGSDKYDYIDIEMERVYNKLDTVFSSKNKNPFWKDKTTNINTNWKNNAISFDCDNNSIVKIDLRKFSIEYGDIIDKEIKMILFEQSITKDKKENIKIEEENYTYTWNQIEPWEIELYAYIDSQCV